MAEPKRIRLSRAKGFNLAATSWLLNGLACRVVARPSRYGNPFVLKPSAAHGCWDVWRGRALVDGGFPSKEAAARNAIKRYRALIESDGVRRRAARELRGFNLACWCPPDQPCHADVLLEVANA